MDDSIEFESEGEENYTPLQRRLGKRPAREIEDDFDDNIDDFDDLKRDDGGRKRGVKAGGSSSRGVPREDDDRDDDGDGDGDEHQQVEEEEEDEDKPNFRPATMGAIFKGVWTDPGTKAHKEALELSAEYLRLFTIEALHRTAAYQREQEDEELRNEETLIELDSLEAITPQLVMDF
ncbi:hypothetical protein BGZ54_005922 [Gamsiella multidivaricata]|nr:hypothetical protein BGZ54_005922 [Gamsiella multidivaricata]